MADLKYNFASDLSNTVWQANAINNINGLSENSKYSGLFQLLGNLVPSAFKQFDILQNNDFLSNKINSWFSKQPKNWRNFIEQKVFDIGMKNKYKSYLDSFPLFTNDQIKFKPNLSTETKLTPDINIDGGNVHVDGYSFNKQNPVTLDYKQPSFNDYTPYTIKSANARAQQDLFTNEQKQLKIENAHDKPNKSDAFSTGNLTGIAAGAIAGYGVGKGLDLLGNSVFGNSNTGQFAAGALSQVGSSVAGNVAQSAATSLVKGSNVGKGISNGIGSLGSAASLTSAGVGLANLGLDVFHKVKKSNWEQGVGAGLSIASMIPGLGLPFALANLVFNGVGHFTGTRTQRFKADHDILNQAYASRMGSVKDILKSEQLANQRYSGWNLSGRHKDDRQISESARQYQDLQDAVNYNTFRNDLVNNTNDIYSEGYKQDLYGPNFGVTLAKEGGVLDVIQSNKQIDEIKPLKYSFELKPIKVKFQEENQAQSFKEGGSVNIIPEGALHARLHNIEVDNITKKGIPVVSENENGEIVQQAEIEKDEIILRLDVTKKIEELYKKYNETKDEDLAIEAGKFLTHELLYNTTNSNYGTNTGK